MKAVERQPVAFLGFAWGLGYSRRVSHPPLWRARLKGPGFAPHRPRSEAGIPVGPFNRVTEFTGALLRLAATNHTP